MPQKDETKRREASAERVRRYRAKRALQKGVTLEQGVTSLSEAEGVTAPLSVTTGVTLPPEWQNVVNFLHKDPGNLEKLQRIAGSLGRNAEEVRFGVSGPTMDEIGRTISILPPRIGKR